MKDVTLRQRELARLHVLNNVLEYQIPIGQAAEVLGVSPNPPKDTDGRREDSGRGWVRELQGRWPGVLG